VSVNHKLCQANVTPKAKFDVFLSNITVLDTRIVFVIENEQGNTMLK